MRGEQWGLAGARVRAAGAAAGRVRGGSDPDGGGGRAARVPAARAPAAASGSRLALFTAVVDVQLKPGVLDPQGQAVASGLRALGHAGVEDVRVGKQVRLRLRAADEREARDAVERMCRELLASPVLEDYRFTLRREPEA